MHCQSCELLLEESLSEINGVNKVKANYKKSTVEIEAEQIPSEAEVKRAVANVGYKIADDETTASTPSNVWWQSITALVILFIGYQLVSKFSGVIPTKAGLFSSLLVGLAAGFSSCLALVGGLVLAASSEFVKVNPGASWKQKFLPHIYFNLGRIVGFFFLGAVIGLVGSVLRFSPTILAWLTIAVSLIMFLTGLKMLDLFPVLNRWNLTLPKNFGKKLMNKSKNEYSHKSVTALGMGTFFLPCGFTLSQQLYALNSGSWWQGGMIMSLFALGTAVGLLTLAGLVSSVNKSKIKVLLITSGMVLILLGVFNLKNGWNLLSSSAPATKKIINTAVKAGIQEVTMIQKANGYFPNKLTVKAGQKVRWVINSETDYSCAAYIRMPSFGIDQPLSLGQNVIEFTPTTPGTYNFSCSMGMYRGQFIVTE